MVWRVLRCFILKEHNVCRLQWSFIIYEPLQSLFELAAKDEIPREEEKEKAQNQVLFDRRWVVSTSIDVNAMSKLFFFDEYKEVLGIV